MADDIQAKRAYVTSLYPAGTGWARRVKHMSDIQVTAIYLREKAKASSPKPKKENTDECPF